MLNLIRNEWMKIFRRPGTYVMLAILLLIVAITGAFMKYQENGTDQNHNEDWKTVLVQENEALKSQLDSSPMKVEQDYYKKQIAINEYRIEHDIPFREKYNSWSFVKDSSEIIILAGLFTIIVSAGIVASEFTWGTIKLLLIRPINRSKILLSKYLTVLLFALLLVVSLFVFSAVLGTILFGLPEQAIPYLNYFDGQVTEQHMVIYLINYYGLASIEMIMLATMAFMISSVFRNSSLAIGLSIFLMFMGSSLTGLLSMKFTWAKYILFANTNLMQYFEGAPLVEGMTITFSIIMILVYFVIFQFLAFYVFNKRDVAA
ncbi:ABC transporter permease [Neobacillus sp. FSL H8-0543]|uniref:ABC transporter permease n=1 Tax=Neobacillus sp. FSL H8-0543 TaxID=2954672 RepID=UPI003158C998